MKKSGNLKGRVIAKTVRLNEQIRVTPVRLIDENNEQRGVVSTSEAMSMARELGIDLVEIAPTEKPPVCRLMDYGKHKYDLKKKQRLQTGHEITLKEVRLRPKTDDHGHKVQFTMLFRGRERQHRDRAFQMFNAIVAGFGESVKLERPPRFEGRRMTMVVAPAKVVAKGRGK